MRQIYNGYMNKVIRSGTTTVGLVCSDGVIVASDRRATAGFFIAHPHVKKIYRLDDHIVATIAGIVAHAQEVMNITSANIRLYRYTYNRAINVKAAASLISNLLAQARAYPFIIQLLIGGVDKSGPHLFALDPFGTLTEEKYAATGSGASVAIGILEDSFKKGLHVNEAMDVVIRAISSAMKRDPASGGGYDIAIVTSYGIREYSSEKLSVK